MIMVSVDEAKERLPELIDKLRPNEPVVITREQHPVAQLVSVPSAGPRPVYGSCRDKLVILHEDDEHLADFAEYMP
jgi:antitoxin (DNA-binding transcriptional repressor) of toxin-antitoxin stability system